MNTDLTTLLHDRAARVPTAMHPAADLRRQAERHQRLRRAGAVAAATSAVLVIALAAGFLSQGGVRDAVPAWPILSVSPSMNPSESPSVSPDAGPASVTTIPASFRFAEEETSAEWREPRDENQIERSNNRADLWALDPCNPTTYPSDQRRTAMRSLQRSGPEFGESLQLAQYADASSAAAVLADFRGALNRCRDTSPDGGTTRRIWTVEDLDVADGGVIAILRYEVDGLQPPGSQHVAAYRTGNAIFMRSSSGEGLPQAGQPDPTRDEVTASAEQNLARVCALVRCEERE